MYALYARQSVDKPDSISIESQLEFCRYETRGQSFQTYIDRGFSGKDMRRPNFERMLADIRSGSIQTVVVYKLDRVSRSVLDFGKLMEELERRGVTFISATEKFDTQAPMGRAMLNIAMVFAQLERETIQKRVADAYRARSLHGFYMGGRIPYGFRLGPAEIEGIHTSSYLSVPEEAEQVRLIFALYAQKGNSMRDVLHYFESHGLRHLRGGRWNTARLSELLRSPVYVRADAKVYQYYKERGTELVNRISDFQGINGCYLYKQRQAKENGLFTLVLAPHEGIVSAAVWLACRKKCVAASRQPTQKSSKRSWIAGLVKCANCGCALSVKTSRAKMARYFVCGGKYTDKRCSGAGTVYVDAVEDCLSRMMVEKLNKIMPMDFKLTSLWERLEWEQRKEITDTLVDSVQILNQQIEIYWKF